MFRSFDADIRLRQLLPAYSRYPCTAFMDYFIIFTCQSVLQLFYSFLVLFSSILFLVPCDRPSWLVNRQFFVSTLDFSHLVSQMMRRSISVSAARCLAGCLNCEHLFQLIELMTQQHTTQDRYVQQQQQQQRQHSASQLMTVASIASSELDLNDQQSCTRTSINQSDFFPKITEFVYIRII